MKTKLSAKQNRKWWIVASSLAIVLLVSTIIGVKLFKDSQEREALKSASETHKTAVSKLEKSLDTHREKEERCFFILGDENESCNKLSDALTRADEFNVSEKFADAKQYVNSTKTIESLISDIEENSSDVEFLIEESNKEWMKNVVDLDTEKAKSYIDKSQHIINRGESSVDLPEKLSSVKESLKEINDKKDSLDRFYSKDLWAEFSVRLNSLVEIVDSIEKQQNDTTSSAQVEIPRAESQETRDSYNPATQPAHNNTYSAPARQKTHNSSQAPAPAPILTPAPTLAPEPVPSPSNEPLTDEYGQFIPGNGWVDTSSGEQLCGGGDTHGNDWVGGC